MSTHWTERLSEFHDGDLTAAEYAECAGHLADCGECRDVLQELHFVTVAARGDADRDPPVDLWPGIMARINRDAPADRDGSARAEPYNRAEPSNRPQSRLWGSRQITFSLPQLAMAASLLIAVSVGVTYLAGLKAGPTSAAQSSSTPEATIQAMAEPLMSQASDALPANFADAQFDQAVSDLERMLREQRDRLDPRTVVVIERNLTVIDDAIRQAREALDADPANTFLNSHLADARRRKIELLRRATSIAGD